MQAELSLASIISRVIELSIMTGKAKCSNDQVDAAAHTLPAAAKKLRLSRRNPSHGVH
jgi:hypothetical protein